ncbi:hypothetical protein IG631_12438 [Alternaria alternata]|jgi:hypothetical protein|nr:hypothetical protein IG631_12438 [Alternaria alternata]
MASATFLKTGSPRCSVPAFLGFVPPTTFVPAVPSVLPLTGLCHRFRWAHTVFNRLLCVEAVPALASPSLVESSTPTHVPCFPVKPWNRTLVSPLMRRFLIVSAYCEEAVAYCLVAALESAERIGCRIACIVTGMVVTKATLGFLEGIAGRFSGG